VPKSLVARSISVSTGVGSGRSAFVHGVILLFEIYKVSDFPWFQKGLSEIASMKVKFAKKNGFCLRFPSQVQFITRIENSSSGGDQVCL
jgi:hypothetical protein